MGLFGNDFDKDVAMQILRDHNVYRLVLEYSGGNDEGGVDAVRVTYMDGTQEDNPSWCERHYADSVFDKDTGEWKRNEVSAEETASTKRADILEAPVYDRYYSFAGDFYASGTVVYDVQEGTCVMDGLDEVPQSDNIRLEF